MFNTNNEPVWDYVNRLAKFVSFTNRVKAVVGGRALSLPINLLTIDKFFGKIPNLRKEKQFVGALGDKTFVCPETAEG